MDLSKMMCPTFYRMILQVDLKKVNYLLASSIATATATVIPTMGLLPAAMPRFLFGGLLTFGLFMI